MYRRGDMGGSHLRLVFLPDATDDSIEIVCRYSRAADERAAVAAVKQAEKLVKVHALGRGWEWVRTKRTVKRVEN